MRARITSLFGEDDPHRMHRIPFFFWWVMSYALAWLPIYVYEMLWHDDRFYDVLSWLKFETKIETFFVGFLFGFVLMLTQGWLLRLRYGYVPRYFRVATIIGATIAGGFVYPIFGKIAVVQAQQIGRSILHRYFVWFIVLSFFQMIAIWNTSRKAWLILVAAILASAITNVFFIHHEMMYVGPKWVLIVGTFVHAAGTACVMLYLLENPYLKVARKHKKKIKNAVVQSRNGMSTILFIITWGGQYLFGLLVLETLVRQLFGFFLRVHSMYTLGGAINLMIIAFHSFSTIFAIIGLGNLHRCFSVVVAKKIYKSTYTRLGDL